MFMLDGLDSNAFYTCGGLDLKIGGLILIIVKTVVDLIKIGVPIILIIMGMMDLGKAVMAQKDDEIKKGQQTFFKRLLAAAIVFFVVMIVQLLVSLLAKGDPNITDCIDCFISNNSCTVNQ